MKNVHLSFSKSKVMSSDVLFSVQNWVSYDNKQRKSGNLHIWEAENSMFSLFLHEKLFKWLISYQTSLILDLGYLFGISLSLRLTDSDFKRREGLLLRNITCGRIWLLFYDCLSYAPKIRTNRPNGLWKIIQWSSSCKDGQTSQCVTSSWWGTYLPLSPLCQD